MSRWRGIILHHSATSDRPGVDAEAFRKFHMEVRGWLDCGYHWIVEDIDGIYHALQGRPATMAGAHCPGKNQDHLGVCFAGNFEAAEMKTEQMIVGAELISTLLVMNDIEPDSISLHKTHRDTACPGNLFPFDELIRMTRVMIGY